MTASVQVLRDRLASREATLTSLRSRVGSAKNESYDSRPRSTISDIQKRYLSAVAQLETKEKELPKPVIRSSTDAVSSLASKWNSGMEETKVEKTTVDVRGDIAGAKKNFSIKDAPPKAPTSNGTPPQEKEKAVDHGPAQFIVEDDSEVPSWAKNQQKLVIKKENARSSVRDVDVRNLQGSVLENAARDGSEAERTKISTGGNVKAALAMWGKTADEDAKALARKKEEDKKRAENARKEKEAAQTAKVVEAATRKFAEMKLSELTAEPNNEHELVAFLERKIVLVEEEIKSAEDELDKLEK